MLRFAVGIVAALAVAYTLEVVTKLRGGRLSGDTAVEERVASPRALAASSRSMSPGRLILSALIGFFFGAVTAGVLEASGADTIAFGSLAASLLIAGWTFLAWLYLALRD